MTSDPAAITKALNETSDYAAVTGKIAFKNGSRIPSKPVAIMYDDHGKVNLKATVTPEPVSMTLMATGLSAIGLAWRRRRGS